MGDDFFLGQFPFVDIDNGGSVRGLVANLEKILPMLDKDVKIIPGHGTLGDKPALQEWTNALKGTVAIMNEAVQKGLTLEQVKKEKTLAAWEHLANGFVTLDMYEEILYRELAAAKK